MSLRIAEIFGPTVQGEGPSTGRRCSFIRLSGCNLSCSWCDTPYTWDWKGKNGVPYDPAQEMTRMEAEVIADQIDAHGTDRVVITGGEPLTQARELTELVAVLDARGYMIEIETNGTRPAIAGAIRWNVSPKLAHAGDSLEDRIDIECLKDFATRFAAFKFVCASVEDLDEVEALVKQVGIGNHAVWIMPEGKTPDAIAEHLQLVAEAAIAKGYNITNRLHVNIWGDRRGV
jgi:7-cyano-7-deazaguanosine (preQ0) biosynthesis protein QueE